MLLRRFDEDDYPDLDDQEPQKPYVYETCCVRCESAEDLHDMVEAAKDSTYQTVLRNCSGLLEWATSLGYEKSSKQGLTLKNDQYVGYSKSVFRGKACFYVYHSHIEYIWVKREKS